MVYARAAVVEQKHGPFVVREVELGEPREDEVLVKVVAAGICHTDLIVRDQWYPVPLPAILGHEGAGVVEAVGSRVTKVKPGDHVVLTFLSCGRCRNCLRGRPSYCLDLYRLNFGGSRPDGSSPARGDGQPIHAYFFGQSSFATYSIAHERNVVPVPEDVPLEYLGPLGCGIQTGAGGVFNSLHPEAGSSIVVFGTGTVGLSAVMAARLSGCTTIIGVDIRPQRLELARELGATHVINAQETEVVQAIRELTGGGADYSIETTASPRVFRQAVDCLNQLGVCGLIGAAPMGTETSLDMNTILFGRTVRGIIEGDSVPDLFIPQLVELYRQGTFPIDRLMRIYSLDEINQAAADSEEGRVVKPVLRMAA
ncbi:NAD(P)-dependent alcohol dehydrogenase [Thermomicrobiaceae bacterium CFH 74404]|uniref:NAD(P)-dependent alcohol dehydrogenase n=1 Tax=Thermalbibacter longus TaxID=2951981 RepID=A0AA41WAJ1_9BACT|nr:NAD(P)-dependent alcohol dehydrogenase [Thermalbibacter longus]MCM8748766.1 NAD(P)-dependent alcohol dehydrogenase [Thermalbibacter longus]